MSLNETPATPAHDAIATLAHALWEERGCPIGSPEVDWCEAEQMLGGAADEPLRAPNSRAHLDP